VVCAVGVAGGLRGGTLLVTPASLVLLGLMLALLRWTDRREVRG
jgi:hypothetical protein